MQDSVNKNECSEQTVNSLLERLSEVYCSYQENDHRKLKAKYGITRLFRRWFSYNTAAVDSMHQEFLNDVESIINELSTTLNKLSQDAPDICNTYAAKAVNLMLAPKPTGEKTTVEWYMTIAEYHCSALLPCLAIDELKRTKDNWLGRLPKRLMYPRQRELLKDMEKYILGK